MAEKSPTANPSPTAAPVATGPAGAIPFNHSSVEGQETGYIHQSVLLGQIAGDQGYSHKCQALLERVLGAAKVLLTPSGTHALELAGLLLPIGPNDEVIVPSFTFASTANAFALRGARLRFVDIRRDTLNLDEKQLESLVTPRTRAIVPVHYAGVACEMDTILSVARRYGIPVIEDNAHGLFGRYKQRWLGTLGTLATLSFHATKNITCGEGGALVINDPSLIERAEIMREKGTNRSRFFRGEVDKYTWTDLGSSYVMSDVLAAFLFGQLEVWREIQEKRRAIWRRYDSGLRDWASPRGVGCPSVPEDCQQAYHMYYLVLPTLQIRQALIAHLKHRGIMAVFHYLPLHLSPMGQRMGGHPGDCPVSETVSDRLLRLPFFNSLAEAAQTRVIEAIQDFKF
ncbi:MAG TPA: dTDP-4-amino-4,6-dideoxygalactose transaminase [Polyangia bacterium]